jgi:ectoine hydroxylase-related dioxygenase (phytanoyl-CoA dioxygenase family)
MALSTSQVDLYKQQGFLNAIPVLEGAEASHYAAEFDRMEQQVGKEKAQIELIDCHFDEQFIWQLATHPTILDCIEDLIGPDILLLATHFFNKYGEGTLGESYVAWHQDVTFWGLEPPLAITAWYAVDDSDVENGCMQVIPGTHDLGMLEHGKASQKGNLLSINQEAPVSEEMAQTAVDLELEAGSMSIHDGTLIHGSLPNQSTRRRCGLTLRYVPTYVAQIEDNSFGKNWQTLLVRGEDKHQNFTHVPMPFA